MPLEISIEYDLRQGSFIIDGEERFIAQTERGFFKLEWTLFDSKFNELASYVLKPVLSFLNRKLQIDYKKNLLTLFYDGWKPPHIRFNHQKDQYLIIIHRGSRISFFKNKIQYAVLEKIKVNSHDRTYEVVADTGVEVELFVVTCYAVLILLEDEVPLNTSIKFNSGRELERFDYTWRPK